MQDTEGMTGLVNILEGNCLDILPTLEPASVQCCVTSPPYWGLRDYGTATWDGGAAGCEHKQSNDTLERQFSAASTLVGTTTRQKESAKARYRCHCGARRIDSQLGLESTPAEYIANMVRVFREVWRVLEDDGTLWLNIGDSYAGYHGNSKAAYEEASSNKNGYFENQRSTTVGIGGLKPKDLCGIPWRLAFALQADGWYLRSDIIWAKPNPMPESVTDRPTKSHEYIFLLTKQERYFYDAASIKEPLSPETVSDRLRRKNGTIKGARITDAKYTGQGYVRNDKGNPCGENGDSRNKRTVWTVATQPYSEAHFATFPEDLIKPCILAGSRIGDTVLDPFAGSGTVGEVCTGLGRKSVLIELNPEYIEMIKIRTNVTIGML